MKKIETIWHYLLEDALTRHNYQHTQAGLAEQFGYSTSTVNLALVKPSAIGAVRKSGKFFVLADPVKLLYLWATIRNLDHDIIYHTTSPLAVNELEGLAPAGSIYGGYSSARLILGEPPADYSRLFLYIDSANLGQIKLRYPMIKKGASEINILKKPDILYDLHHTSLPHTFVDIWNMPDWYAKDFLNILEERIHGLLS